MRCKSSEIEQNDFPNDFIGQKLDMVSKTCFIKLFVWLCWTTLLLINVSQKSSWVAQKGD